MSDLGWEHEKRSREIADSMRRYLVLVNSGAIGITFALVGALVPFGYKPSWAVYPISFFATGLVAVGVSLMFAKHREIKRRDAKENGENEPKFCWSSKSFAWDSFSLAMFIVGAFVGIDKLQCIAPAT